LLDIEVTSAFCRFVFKEIPGIGHEQHHALDNK
jgi:hypothetical protein